MDWRFTPEQLKRLEHGLRGTSWMLLATKKMEQKKQKRKRINKKGRKIDWAGQILIIFLPVLLFLTSAAVGEWFDGQTTGFSGRIAGILTLDSIYAVCWGIWFAWRIPFHPGRIRCGWQNRGWLWAVLLYTIGIRIVQIGDIQRWDASAYYIAIRNGCEKFAFTLSSFLEGFSVASHPTWGYLGILGIGEFLFEGKVEAVQFINLVLTVIGVYCLYCIMEQLLPEKDNKFIALSVIVLSSLPVFAGTFSYCNPDMGVAFFTVFMIFCYIRKKWILLLFCMLGAVTSKETGVLAIGGFAAGVFVCRVKKGNGNLVQKVRYAMQDYLCREALIVGICGLAAVAIYLANGGGIWNLQSESKAEFSTFRVIPSFIWNNLKQFFWLNFNWISTLLAAGCIGKAVGEKKKGIKREPFQRPELIAGILGAFLGNIFFYCLYITFTLARYHIIIDILWNMLMLFCIGRYMDRIKLRNLMVSLYAVCLVCQAYVTVDPVSKAAFIMHDTDGGTILTTQHPREDLLTIITGDYSVYNHQYNYAAEAIEYILRDVDYHEGMDILSFLPTEMQINGILWDRHDEKLTYNSGSMTIPLRVIHGSEVYQTESGSEAVYIFYAQSGENPEENMEHLNWYYDFYYRGEVKIQYGGTFYYWVGRRN